jgi:hypothetical protein
VIHKCLACGTSIEAMIVEEVTAAAGKQGKQTGKVKALKAERKSLRAERNTLTKKADTLTQQAAVLTGQVKALQAEVAVLRAPSTASGAAAKEEATVTVDRKGVGKGRRTI